MITSILDTDLYKLTMGNAVFSLFPKLKVRYMFYNRGKTEFPDGFAARLREEIGKLSQIRLKPDEKNFLSQKCPYLYPTYIDFLEGYKFDPKEVGVVQRNSVLDIEIEGLWYRTILWEVPLMAMISELYFEMTGERAHTRNKRQNTNLEKAKFFYYNNVKVADFGTRRRFSKANQHEVIADLLSAYDSSKWFVGTSNVELAMKHNIKPIGTQAHEWFMAHGALYGFKMANNLALENWVNVYEGDLGIALSDTYTSDVFLQTAFNKKYAKLFDGVRQDSGDALEFASKMYNHYKGLNINPQHKTIVFSDGLNIKKIQKIEEHCKSLGIQRSYGVGTNLSNDVGVRPLNIVIKLDSVYVNGDWNPAIKISDAAGKSVGDADTIFIANKILNL